MLDMPTRQLRHTASDVKAEGTSKGIWGETILMKIDSLNESRTRNVQGKNQLPFPTDSVGVFGLIPTPSGKKSFKIDVDGLVLRRGIYTREYSHDLDFASCTNCKENCVKIRVGFTMFYKLITI